MEIVAVKIPLVISLASLVQFASTLKIEFIMGCSCDDQY